jgi:PE family
MLLPSPMVSLITGWEDRHGACDRGPGDGGGSVDGFGDYQFDAQCSAHGGGGTDRRSDARGPADEVSASMAQLFSQHAQDYQASARQAAAFQEQFAQNLKTSAASYTSIEDAIASLLRSFETSLSSFYGALVGQIVRFIIGSESWINLVPPPLRTFVVGVPFLSIFVIAIPVAILLTLTEAVIEAITGLPGVI